MDIYVVQLPAYTAENALLYLPIPILNLLSAIPKWFSMCILKLLKIRLPPPTLSLYRVPKTWAALVGRSCTPDLLCPRIPFVIQLEKHEEVYSGELSWVNNSCLHRWMNPEYFNHAILFVLKSVWGYCRFAFNFKPPAWARAVVPKLVGHDPPTREAFLPGPIRSMAGWWQWCDLSVSFRPLRFVIAITFWIHSS